MKHTDRVITDNFREPTAAAYLGQSARTLRNLRLKGGGPVFLKLGRIVLYRRSDLDRWLSQRAVLKKRNSDDGVLLAEVCEE